MIHPTIKDGINPARKKIHTPNEKGGRKVEPFSNDMNRLNNEISPIFEVFWEELAWFFIWISPWLSEFEVDGNMAPKLMQIYLFHPHVCQVKK